MAGMKVTANIDTLIEGLLYVCMNYCYLIMYIIFLLIVFCETN